MFTPYNYYCSWSVNYLKPYLESYSVFLFQSFQVLIVISVKDQLKIWKILATFETWLAWKKYNNHSYCFLITTVKYNFDIFFFRISVFLPAHSFFGLVQLSQAGIWDFFQIKQCFQQNPKYYSILYVIIHIYAID